jgi:uncharacterized Fe-S cluster-containing radical SAM superfamily enzyme
MLGAEGVQKLQLEQPQTFQKPVEQPQVNENFVANEFVLQNQIASVLGLASMESGRYSQEITELIDWAKANGAKSMDDILYEIRYLSNRLGNNPNEKKIKTVSRFIFLANERNRLNTEIERMQSL